ncbi:MAG: J domain-containing protein [Sphingomicrobium sp.]
MADDRSAYAVLGLAPDADRAAIELAYKRLIKLYHPDREGGDAALAAEINQAYFELRGAPQPAFERPQQFDLAEALYAQRAARRRQRVMAARRPRLWPVFVMAIAAVAVVNREKLEELATGGAVDMSGWLGRPGFDTSGSAPEPAPLDGALNEAAIADAARSAARLARAGNTERLIAASRDCQRAFRESPDLAGLDRCAAFDDAVIEVDNRDAVREGGSFGPSSVTARQIAAARLLSQDYEAIEDRLDRVRSRVQHLLAPPPPPPPRSDLAETPAGSAGGLAPVVGGPDGAAAH